jgi:hypothetical protein
VSDVRSANALVDYTKSARPTSSECREIEIVPFARLNGTVSTLLVRKPSRTRRSIFEAGEEAVVGEECNKKLKKRQKKMKRADVLRRVVR